LWEAWLVFFSLRTGRALATDRETTQSTREHVIYWATGLTETYLQGALERALALTPEAQLARRIAREEQAAYTLAEAQVYAAAAVGALRAAETARRRRAGRARARVRAHTRRQRARR
jgi:hypothetical protein